MDGLIVAGLASLVIQSQVFITILLAVVLNAERLRASETISLLLTISGMAVLVARADGGTTPIGLGLVIGAGLCWATRKNMARTIDKKQVFGLTIRSCLFATPFLGVSAQLIEGPAEIGAALTNARRGAWPQCYGKRSKTRCSVRAYGLGWCRVTWPLP